MKSVLISIQPKWVEKIASGEKTIEVRKTRPKLETPFKCYIYCTNGNGSLNDTLMSRDRRFVLNQKVIGEFVCNYIDELEEWELSPCDMFYKEEKERLDLFLKRSCLSYDEICDYRKNLSSIKPLYGWHISDLKIYDKPKALSEFYRDCPQYYSSYEEGICAEMCVWYDMGICKNFSLPITRPPQSWQFVESLG